MSGSSIIHPDKAEIPLRKFNHRKIVSKSNFY